MVVLLVPVSLQTQAQTTSSRAGGTLVDRLKGVFSRDKDEEAYCACPNPPANNRNASSRNWPARVQQGDLLPKGIFDRNADPGHRGNENQSADAVFQDLSRPASGTSGARRSPPATRENELDEALADLLSTDLDGSEIESPVADERISQGTAETASKPFDLREALLSKSQGSKSQDSSPRQTVVSQQAAGNSATAINDLREQFEALDQPARNAGPTLTAPSKGEILSPPRDREAERIFTQLRAPQQIPATTGHCPGYPPCGRRAAPALQQYAH